MLHSSRFFHICKNLIFDPMHDIFCGPIIIKLVLAHYVMELKFFKIQDFNDTLVSFNYGFVERKNKPSANFDERILNQKGNTLNQKAMQIWCLLRAFPFLISDWVPKTDKHLQIILFLLKIMEIVFAPKVTINLMSYLKALITDFLQEFKKLFPTLNVINKFHQLMHYPDCMLWSGPLQLYNCMRYEAKHNEIKVRAQIVNNFKNPSKTLIRIVQCSQSARKRRCWEREDATTFTVKTYNEEIINVQDCKSRTYLHTIEYVDNESVFNTNAVKVNGVEFRLCLLVCLEVDKQREDNLPLFGRIDEILMLKNNEAYFLTTLCKTHIFDTDFNAYHINFEMDETLQRFINYRNPSRNFSLIFSSF